MKYNDRGEELLDDTPLEAPLSFRRPPSIQELIAMHVRAATQVDKAMGKDDEEDFSEEVEADEILTPYELHAYAGEADSELRRAEEAKKIVSKYIKRKEQKDGSNESKERVGRDVSVGEADSKSKGTGPEAVSRGAEKDRGVT